MNTDPALWTVRAVFGAAGGPDEIILTDEGNARAFSVGARVRRDGPAEALEALHAASGLGYLCVRVGVKIERSALSCHAVLAWEHLRALGMVSVFHDETGDGVRLTDVGDHAARAGIAERERLLERCRRAAAVTSDACRRRR